MKRLVLAAALLAASAAFGQEAVNPFTSTGRPASAVERPAASPVSSALFGIFAPIQRVLNESLASVTRSLGEARSPAGWLLVVGLSIAYGIFHAAGPGHGKAIVASYLMSNDAGLRHAVMVGYLIAVVHVASAVGVVLVLSFVVRGIFAVGLANASRIIQIVSLGAVALIGGIMLVNRIRGVSHHHHHGHGPHGEEAPGGGVTLARLAAIAVPAGMIPCPGAVAVILFALSMNMFVASLVSVVSMSIGMGATISLAAALALVAKRGAVAAIGRGEHERSSQARRFVEIAGAAAVFLIGVAFLLAQL